jgi:hypothetical protein
MLQIEKPSGFRSEKYDTLGGPGGVGQREILLEDIVAIWIHPLDPNDHMLLQKALTNLGVDSFTNANENY